jgi:hypothetical protein
LKIGIKDYINTNDNDRDNLNTENIFEEFYLHFTEAEVEKCLETLKKNKAVGSDNMINEYILTGKAELIPVLCKPFRVIF